MYPDSYFPMYCGGPGYLLSAPALQGIMRVAPHTRSLHLEDVFITGFCRTVAGIDYIHIPGVQASKQIVPCEINQVYNIHQINVLEMRAYWELLDYNKNTPCDYLSSSRRIALAIIIILCVIGYALIHWLKQRKESKFMKVIYKISKTNQNHCNDL